MADDKRSTLSLPKKQGDAPVPDAPEAAEAPLPASAAPAAEVAVDLARQVAALQAEIERLKAAAAESFIPAINHDASFAGTEEDENGRPIEMYHYRVDLPPSGGTDIKINGRPFYHGQQYKVSRETLATLTDIVARNWVHNAQIMGSNENAYRRPKETTLHGVARR